MFKISIVIVAFCLWAVCCFVEVKAIPKDSDNEPDFPELMKICNASFSIPISDVENFHNTGELPDTSDKTGMCYIRCMWEKSGLINNWVLNADLIRSHIWPATGDALDVCANTGIDEQNACVRTYMIARCLMMRSIVDAQNKPTV
uniref:Odorant binding protein n=1 Tax=Liriomyza trifolii TaxID=198433 RepID=A0A2Z4SZ77_LIRTR|nr:odorant binding protein [Liriomyza trifolii]